MRFETLRDVIQFSRELHEELAERYEDVRDHSTRERARLLLDYLARHERHLQQSLQRYQRDAADRLLDAWFSYMPEHRLEDIVAEVEMFADMEVDQILAEALKLDDHLIALYREMAQRAPSVQVREVCQNLLQLEASEQIRAARGALSLQDM